MARGAIMNEDHISLKLPREKDEKDQMEEKEFTMYVMDISYFSGKLECYFNFQVVPPFLAHNFVILL